MSIISQAAHTVTNYDGKNKAFTGQRLAKFTWKTVTDKNSAMYNIKRDSKCVSLPVVTGAEISSNLAALTPHITNFLHGVQDKIVREILESGNDVRHVSNESISIAAICEYLDASDESGRLTKESVIGWFNDTLSDNLAVALSVKLGVSDVPTDAESAKILAVVGAFKDKIAALAGGKTAYAPQICTSLLSALELAPAGDVLAVRFTARLNKMIEDSKAGEELLLAL